MKLVVHTLRSLVALVALAAFAPSVASAQGVTTGSLTGVVTDQAGAPVAGANVIAIHLPSGSTYEATTRADGRFSMPAMRVGGPYSVTVAYGGSGGAAFSPVTKEDVTVNLGVASDLAFTTEAISVQETVTVSGTVDPVFSSSRTGAATSVGREEIAVLPTLSGRLSDVTRLTPQASNNGFAGNDNRMNNITVDGSSFNNSFGLGGQPGDRTGVAAISLEALEQIQVNVAPFDVRQGSFIGAGVNSVTRSGTNRLVASAYHRFRDQEWVGTEAKGQTVNPGTFTFRNTGGYLAGPILKNKLFAFANYEDQSDKRPLTTFRANQGGEPVGGQVTRVLASDMTTLSAFLKSRFDYDTGPFEGIDDETPAKRFLIRSDYNLNNANKLSVRYTHLNSFTDVGLSNSASALQGRTGGSTQYLSYQNSNYKILENIRSGIGEWNTVIGGSMSNQFQAGYTYQDESRDSRGKLFPFVDIFEGGSNYTSFGFEPFTVNNELRYKTFQAQNNFTKFATRHSITAGAYIEKYHSDNVFFGCCPQSAYSYNSLADFYADANDAAANPNRTVSPVTLRAFQVRWANIPGLEKPEQPLDVWYGAGYLQDEWRPMTNLTVTAGVRVDVSAFENTAYPNPAADALTFRDEAGAAIRYNTGEMPSTKLLWSPRVGANWDVFGDQSTQLRGGGGLFSGRPAYVWISNQIGNTGVLIGERIVLSPGTAFPFSSDPDRYKQAATGAGASSYALNVTDPDFKFPQVWRANVAVDRKLPGGIVSTTEYLYAKDVNGIYYFNANLPAAQSAFAGVDSRPRWVGTACAATGQAGGCVNRINNDTGNQVTQALVLKNGNSGSSWNFAQTLSLNTRFGLSVRTAYSYGESRTISDPESTAATSFARNSHSADPNNPGNQVSMWSPGHRVFALVNYNKRYFGFGATSVSLFWEAQHSTVTSSSRFSYTFAGDMNGDGVAANDLIYIPRDTSEMNFSPFTVGGRTFTAAEQAAAFEAYIGQDKYLSKNRGRYASRNGGVMPIFRRMDLSLTQDLFKDIRGQRNGLQFRADILNVGNLLNSNWGVSQRPVASINNNNQLQILTNPAVDASGRATYRLAVVNNELIRRSFQTSAGTGDVWQFMLSLRYSFN
ncbi:MAG: TonB-dependent receptor [Acidobacteria bacterium]|nr:TonB-dependent receptor [Acidobacteriota bacterium]